MNEFEFTGKCWKQGIPVIDNDGNESLEWQVVPITSVPVECLLIEYEDMVHELSNKTVELYKLKEAYLIAEKDIIANTDFKGLYGANNQKVRDNHVKSELEDMYHERKNLEFSIDFIRNYIPLLQEVLRSKE